MVDSLLTAIADALKRGDEVRLTGFGTFRYPRGRASPQPADGRAGNRRRLPPTQVQGRQGTQGRSELIASPLMPASADMATMHQPMRTTAAKLARLLASA